MNTHVLEFFFYKAPQLKHAKAIFSSHQFPSGNLKNSSGLELRVVLLINLEELLPIRERLDLKRGSQKWSKALVLGEQKQEKLVKNWDSFDELLDVGGCGCSPPSGKVITWKKTLKRPESLSHGPCRWPARDYPRNKKHGEHDACWLFVWWILMFFFEKLGNFQNSTKENPQNSHEFSLIRLWKSGGAPARSGFAVPLAQPPHRSPDPWPIPTPRPRTWLSANRGGKSWKNHGKPHGIH